MFSLSSTRIPLLNVDVIIYPYPNIDANGC